MKRIRAAAAVLLILLGLSSLQPSAADHVDGATTIRVTGGTESTISLAWQHNGAVRYDVYAFKHGVSSDFFLYAYFPATDPGSNSPTLYSLTTGMWSFKMLSDYADDAHDHWSNTVTADIPYTGGTSSTTTTTPPPGNECNINPANDFAAIEAAIASCPDGASADNRTVIRFPVNAAYRLTDKVDIVKRQNVVLDGRGSTFTATWPQTPDSLRSNFMLFKARNVTVRNVNMVGTFNPDPAIYPKRQIMSHYCEAQAGVVFYGGVNVTVEDSSAYRTCGDGFGGHRSEIYSDNYGPVGEAKEVPTNITFQRLRSKTVARMCWGPTSSIGTRVIDNDCEDAWYGGIDIEKDAYEPVKDVEIARNRFRHFNIYGVTIPVGSTPEGPNDNIRVYDNVFETPPDNKCYPSVWIGTAQYDRTMRFTNVHTYGNTIYAIGAAVAYNYVDGGSIHHNTVHRLPTTGGGTVLQECGWGAEIFVLNDSTNVAVYDNTVIG